MYIIEPCCSHRQLAEIRRDLRKGGTTEFKGFGDLSLTELLPALLTYYNETEMMVVAPSLPDQAAEIISTWARWKWARMDGSGKFFVLRHLTVIGDLSPDRSPTASVWLRDNPFGERLTLVDRAQEDTAVLLPDIAITGPLNLRYGRDFVCTVTTDPAQVRRLWERYAESIKEPAQQEAGPVKRVSRRRKAPRQ